LEEAFLGEFILLN